MRREVFSPIGHEDTFFVGLADGQVLQVVEDNKVGPETGSDRAEVAKTIMPSGVDGSDLEGRHGGHAHLNGLAHTMVNVAFGDEIAGELVIRGEGTVDGIV